MTDHLQKIYSILIMQMLSTKYHQSDDTATAETLDLHKVGVVNSPLPNGKEPMGLFPS